MTQPVNATLTPDGSKIILSGGTYPHRTFIETLPAARWNANKLQWTCAFTPIAAWRIASNIEDCNLSPDIDRAYNQFSYLKCEWDACGHEMKEQPERGCQTLWEHQVATYHFVRTRGWNAILALKMGVGKSVVAVTAGVNSGARLILIVCPLAVCPVWRREYLKWAGYNHEVIVLDRNTVRAKMNSARKHVELQQARNQPAVVVINYDSARELLFQQWSLSVKWDMVIGDEAHKFCNPATKTSKYMHALSKVAKSRLALTGTPMKNSPIDIYGIVRFVDEGLFGSWSWFKQRYAQYNPMFPSKIDKLKEQDELNEKLKLLMYVVDDDVLDLPEATHQEIMCPLSPKAQKIYDVMEEEMVVQVENGTMAASNSLVNLLRLRQITSGFATNEQGQIARIDDAKLMALGELLDDIATDDPVVVFCQFKADLAVVKQMAENLGRTYGEVSGDRKDLDGHGCMPPGMNCLGVQIAAGGVGVDLTRARYGVYYSVSFALVDFDQSLARIRRPGQTRPVTYYHLIAPGTVDHAVYGALRNKRDLIQASLDYLKKRETVREEVLWQP